MEEKKHLLIYTRRINAIKKELTKITLYSALHNDKQAITTLLYELKMRQVGYFQLQKYFTLIKELWKQGYKLHELNTERIKSIVLDFLSNEKWANDTKISKISTLKSMIRILNEYQIINVDLTQLKFRTMSKIKPVEEMDIPTKEEVTAIIDYAPSLVMKTIIAIASDVGLRIGELLSLQRRNVKVEDYKITLSVLGKTGYRKVVLFKPTNGYNYLLKFLKYNKLMEVEPDRFIFRKRGKENVPKTYQSVRKSFDLIIQKLKEDGIITPSKRITLHTLRHYAVSEYAKSGVPDMVLKKQFGWSKTSKMLARYTTISFEVVEEFAKKVQLKDKK